MKTVPIRTSLTLDDYGAQAHLADAVTALRARARDLARRLEGRKVWMVNSTAQGGGVAEMLPRLVSMLCELGADTEWVVLETDREPFFALTKQLHNLIHGEGDLELPSDARELYEAVNDAEAGWLRDRLRPEDVLVVHDPQPMGLGARLAREIGCPTIWRCHIGLDDETRRTRTAWEFLRPYAAGYGSAVFSVPEYVPEYFADRASIIAPALDPLSHKNRALHPHKLVGILVNSGLMAPNESVLTPPFGSSAQRLQPDGSWATAATADRRIELLFRPTILEVSRWDRLKGFAPLLDAFVTWKRRPGPGDDALHERRRSLARLVLAGPDPESVADDPEGVEVLEELSARYTALDPDLQRDVVLLALPMDSQKQNALMVNALQRCASLVVQNSIREGFGLTVTEAMYKRLPVLASRAAGPRSQIEHGVHGWLIDDQLDPEGLADSIDHAMRDRIEAHSLAEAAQLRAHREFLVFRQAERWLETMAASVERERIRVRAAH